MQYGCTRLRHGATVVTVLVPAVSKIGGNCDGAGGPAIVPMLGDGGGGGSGGTGVYPFSACATIYGCTPDAGASMFGGMRIWTVWV